MTKKKAIRKRRKDSGLTRADADKFRELAGAQCREGQLEVDDDAPISCGDPAEGSYVQAWIWVPTPEGEE